MGISEDFYSVASYDGIVKIVTVAIWILMVTESLLFVYLFWFAIPLSSSSILIVVFILCVSVIVLLVPYLFAPKGYRLVSEGLWIERPLNHITIPYNQITKVQKGKWTWKALRLGASGGVYGYIGFFYLTGVGEAWMYVTDRHKMVLIETKKGKKYVVSPDNPVDFISNLKKKTINFGER